MNWRTSPLTGASNKNSLYATERNDSPRRQWLEGSRRNLYFQPEKMLALAILQDAIALLHKFQHPKNARQQRLFRDARIWIWHEDDRWPFSFRQVCAALDIDPDYMHRGLRRWIDAPVGRPPAKLEQQFKSRKTYRRAS